MVIYNVKRATVVEKMHQEVLPDHKIRHEAKYFYCKGEPAYANKSKDKVVYLQRVVRSFNNLRVVDTEGTIEKLFVDEGEDLYMDNEMYRTRKVCRHDSPMMMSSCELRYKVYLRFIDKFYRDQGTVMLIFARAKPISACLVINPFFSISLSLVEFAMVVIAYFDLS